MEYCLFASKNVLNCTRCTMTNGAAAEAVAIRVPSRLVRRAAQSSMWRFDVPDQVPDVRQSVAVPPGGSVDAGEQQTIAVAGVLVPGAAPNAQLPCRTRQPGLIHLIVLAVVAAT